MSDPPPSERSGWKARRHRRRDRQRAALQAEVATHDPSDVAHFEKTARRYFREAIRAKLREHMLAPWDDDGAHGLRVVIDLGMQELMCDAERRSLVTQLQLSYADPLRLAVDAVEKASVSDIFSFVITSARARIRRYERVDVVPAPPRARKGGRRAWTVRTQSGDALAVQLFVWGF